MATGKQHAQAARKVIKISVFISLLLTLLFDLHAIAGPVGAICGWLIDPDLDHHHITSRSERRIWNVNPVLGYLWEVFWYPMARAIPHRHWLSHLPPIGTFVRLGYMVGPWLWRYRTEIDFAYCWMDHRWALWILFWWVYQDYVHFALDGYKVRRARWKVGKLYLKI